MGVRRPEQDNPAQVTDPTGPPTGTSEQNTDQAPPQDPPETPPAQTPPPPLHEHPEFKDRMEQAKRSAQRELLAALGFDGVETPDGLKTAQQKLAEDLDFAREQRQANMTAEERLNAQIDSLTSERDQLKADLDQYKRDVAQAQQALESYKVDQQRTAAIEAAAAAEGAARPADAIMWARTYRPDDYAAVIRAEKAEDGETVHTVDDDKVKALVTACAEARPDWFAARTPGSPSHGGARPPAAPSGTVQKQKEQARTLVRRGMR